MTWAVVQALALIVAGALGGAVFWGLFLTGQVPPLALAGMAVALVIAGIAEARV